MPQCPALPITAANVLLLSIQSGVRMAAQLPCVCKLTCPGVVYSQPAIGRLCTRHTTRQRGQCCRAQDSSKRILLQTTASLLLAPLYVQAADRPGRIQEIMEVLREDFVTRQYYVTGRLSSSIFASNCQFTDPTTDVQGRERYSKAVASLFSPSASKAGKPAHGDSQVIHPNLSMTAQACCLQADLISMKQTGDSSIELRWRFEAALNVPGRPRIKPYLGTTNYTVGDNGKIIRQEVCPTMTRQRTECIYRGHEERTGGRC